MVVGAGEGGRGTQSGDSYIKKRDINQEKMSTSHLTHSSPPPPDNSPHSYIIHLSCTPRFHKQACSLYNLSISPRSTAGSARNASRHPVHMCASTCVTWLVANSHSSRRAVAVVLEQRVQALVLTQPQRKLVRVLVHMGDLGGFRSWCGVGGWGGMIWFGFGLGCCGLVRKEVEGGGGDTDGVVVEGNAIVFKEKEGFCMKETMALSSLRIKISHCPLHKRL